MSCNCNCKCNGSTVVNTVLPMGSTYLVDLTHYLCGGRKVCVSPNVPPYGELSYKVTDIEYVGNDVYAATILVTGTVTYVPIKCNNYNNCCNVCPITEGVYTYIVVPISSDSMPHICAGITNISPLPLCDCASVTRAVSIQSSFQLIMPSLRKGDSKKEDK